MAGLYFLAFYAVRRGKPSPLYFGIFILLNSFFILLKTTALSYYLVKVLSLELIYGINYFTFCLAIVFLGLYFKWIYGKFIPGILINSLIIYFAFLSIIPFTIKYKFQGLLENTIHLSFIIMLTILIFYIFQAIQAKKKGSLLFLIATSILLVSIVNDFLFLNGILKTTEFYSLAVFIFILFQALYISLKNSVITTENKTMASELDYHNKNLEQIIENKTRDIEIMKSEMLEQQDFLQDLKYQLDERKEDLQAQSEMLDVVNKALDVEKKKSDALLLNILPEKIAEELKSTGEAKPMLFPEASVLFTDFVSFSKIAANMTPEELIKELHFYFVHFDEIIEKYKIDKIKTIGDAYLCASGIMNEPGNRAAACVMTGLEICRFMNEILEKRKCTEEYCFEIRIGIHTGPVVSGIVGKTKFAFDIWGDTVNTAKRIESACNPGELNISYSTYQKVKDYFICTSRGDIIVKHKGNIEMFFVNRLHPEYCSDADGYIPNEAFYKIIGLK